MKIFNLFKVKKKVKVNPLLEEYEKGRILQVNNGIDNKEFLKKNG